MRLKNIFVSICLFLPIMIFSQKQTDDVSRTINELNNLLKPNIEIDVINAQLISKIYKNNNLIKQSKIDVSEIIDTNITYNENSNFINIKCIDYECVENKFFTNTKKKNYTKTLKLHISDIEKGKKATNLLRILANQANIPEITKIKQRNLDFKLSHHLISAMPLLLFWNGFGLSYEYISKSEKTGLYFPVTFTFDNTYIDFGTALKFYTGKNIAHNYKFAGYPVGVLKIRYFLGPEVLYSIEQFQDAVHLRLQNGISIQAEKHWNISFYLSLGAADILSATQNSKYKTGDFVFSWGGYFNLGYRF